MWKESRVAANTDLNVVRGDPVVKIRNIKLSSSFNAQRPAIGRQDFGNLFEHIMLPDAFRSLACVLLQGNTRRQGMASSTMETGKDCIRIHQHCMEWKCQDNEDVIAELEI